MKSTFEINDLFRVIWKHAWIVIISIIAGTSGALLLSRTPIERNYETNTQILVFPASQNNINYATMQDLLLSKLVLGKAIKNYEPVNDAKKPNYSTLARSVITKNTGGSQAISFATKDPSKRNALGLAKSIADAYMKEAKATLPVRNVVLLTKPTINDTKAPSLSVKKTLVFGGGAGLFLGMVLAFVVEATQRLHKVRIKHQ